jgi:SAM-dependent methyltransferase
LLKEDLWKLYDYTYANDYNERYLSNPFSKVTTDTELNVLKSIIHPSARWLDLGCGTGYFLSQFPGIQRAGLDVSPEMIKLAGESNPDALFFKQGDFRQDHAEWLGAWTLVTCMWGAYCYVDTVQEAEQVIQNMIRWTQTEGTIFLPVIDFADVRPFLETPYEQVLDILGGVVAITSITWTWEENGKIHEHLVSPHIEHIVNQLKPFFNKIEILRYPPYKENWVSRKAILATGRRSIKNAEQPADIIRQQIPEAAIKSPGQNQYSAFRTSMSPVSTKHLVSELYFRMRSGAIFKSFARKIYHKILRK